MVLDPRRWDDPATYLTGSFHLRLVECQAQVNVLREALTAAKLELARQQDETRIARWEESISAQDRAISIETRVQHNITEQAEADLIQMIDERDLLMFLIEHP